MQFPKDFVWGAASSSYQIEGAFDQDGKGLSIWDVFCRKPGAIKNGDTGDVACDSYRLYKRDVEMLTQLGAKAYRFSISWPRILPDGTGAVNQKGLDYYDALVDLLLEKGITPHITLYHWDLPQTLQDRGGWLNRDTAKAFAEYAGLVVHHLGERVRHYTTLNEPQCFIGLGYGSGLHAPGLQLPLEQQLTCMHNALLAHGLGCKAIRQQSPAGVQVGIASTGRVCYPSFDTPERRKAARAATFAVSENDWSFTHNWFLDPALLGHYPENAPGALGRFAAQAAADDLAIIHQPLDFLGINLYNGHEVDENGAYIPRYPGFPRTSLKWPVTPEAIRFGCLWLYERYGLPIYITENGQACNDRIFLDGAVHDPDRIDFLHRYLLALEKAMQEGALVKGYFHWSLMDNFEWHNGYDERMGLFYTDFVTQRLIPKDSATWYANLIRQNGTV